ncbi:hypothetical protein [Vibrio splendidus]|uniref:hypothetical protein n=1 Tax=Vibrio splendidus TaxID=29497 RepID=UPI0024698D62|nr:hypothetical protein [Vibrio splendidus]MDH5930942.1 hypothetical protein [Vibrio splendidus]
MRRGNQLKRNIRRTFRSEIESLVKIKNIKEFEIALAKKLKNPVFKSSLLFNKNKFKGSGFSGSTGSFSDSNLEYLLLLIFTKIKKEVIPLKKYVEDKEIYEQHILKGEYDEALHIIEFIGDLFGYSYWYFEAKLSTLSLLGRQSEFHELYDQITKSKINEIELRDLDLIYDRTWNKTKVERITYSLDSLKDGLAVQDALDSYIVDFMHRFNCGEKYNAIKVLSYFWQCNIVDIYNAVLRLSLSNSIDYNEMDNSLLIEIECIAENINDKKLLNFVGKEDHYSDDLKSKYLDLCDLYISGKYEECIEFYEYNFHNDLNIFSPYEFYINSLVNINSNYRGNKDSVFGRIIKSSLKYNKESGDSLKKLFLMLNHIDALQVLAIREEKCVVNFDREKVERIYSYFEFTSFPINPFNPKNRYENSLSSKITHSNIFDEVDSSIPDYRNKKRIGDFHFHEKTFSEAITVYKSILNAPKHMKDEINNKIILCYFHNNEVNNACNFICDLYFNNNLNIDRVDCKKILETLEMCEPADEFNVEIPISVYLIASQINEDQIVALYLDDYLDTVDVQLPSELESTCQRLEFLMYQVCNLSVLESLHTVRDIYASSSERLLDRMMILSKLDVNNLPNITQEIKFLTTQYSRNLCVKDIGKGKINLNFEILAEIVKADKKQNIDCMIDIYNLEKGNFIFDFDSIQDQKDSPIYSAVYEFLSSVRDVYTLDGKYGLDYQLNTKIRHNGIVPAIRSIFEVEGILCKTVEGQYIDNDLFESECKQLLWEAVYNDYQESIKNLSKHIDIRLNKLKRVYMQVMTNDKTEIERLFQFPITESDIARFILYLDKDRTNNDYVIHALDLLKVKTSECLKVGRALISIALTEDFLSELKDLKGKLKKIHVQNYKSSISLVYNDLKSKMDDVSQWLDFSEVVGENFSLDVAVYEAENFIKTIFPKVKYNISCTNETGYIFNGKHLDSFVHMFILLFENASKKRKLSNELTIDVVFEQSGKDSIEIEICNDCTDVDLLLIERINQEINTDKYLKNANKEKDSGLFKVKKILEIDFQSDNYINLECDNEKFNFSAKVNISKLIVGEDHVQKH